MMLLLELLLLLPIGASTVVAHGQHAVALFAVHLAAVVRFEYLDGLETLVVRYSSEAFTEIASFARETRRWPTSCAYAYIEQP